jgi:hypothetical protein
MSPRSPALTPCNHRVTDSPSDMGMSPLGWKELRFAHQVIAMVSGTRTKHRSHFSSEAAERLIVERGYWQRTTAGRRPASGRRP